MDTPEAVRLAIIEQLYADTNLTRRYLHTVQGDEPEMIEVNGRIDLTALTASIIAELGNRPADKEN